MSVRLSNGHLVMTFSRRCVNFLKLLLAASGILFIGYFLFLHNETHDYHQIYRVAVSGKKAAWIEAALKTEIDGPYDNSTLVTLCDSKEWIDGLIFKCDPPTGGVVNVRNVILNCVRYAIEAGATSFIIPEIFASGMSPSRPKETTIVPFTHYFDLDFFTSSLRAACPRLTLIPHQNDLYNLPSTANSILLNPLLLTKTATSDTTIITDPSKWHPNFLIFLNTTLTTLSRGPISSLPARPILITLAPPPLFQFLLSYDQPAFISTFGRIIRPNPSIRHLASSVLFSLDQSHSLGLQPGISGIHANKFYGADMRPTNGGKRGMMGYETQSKYHLASCTQYKLKVAYLVAGEADMTRFKGTAGNKSIAVANGMELLRRSGFEQELEEMQALTEDQQGLIDYEVLFRSSVFGGTFESSFSWNVAMRRHVVVSNGSWIPLHTPSTKSHPRRDEGELGTGRRKRDVKAVPIGNHGNGNEQSFNDDVSVLLGAVGTGKISVYEDSLWP